MSIEVGALAKAVAQEQSQALLVRSAPTWQEVNEVLTRSYV